MHLISVLIPTYNSEAFIGDAINSVLWQTYPNFELLLLDDGSTDQTMEIVSSYDDPRIKYIQCPHNFVETRNRGLAIAKGKYIALLDHDDIMMPNRLQIQYDFMESHPEIAACGGYMHTFGWYSKKYIVPLKHVDLILYYSPIWNPTGFFLKKIIDQHAIRYKEGYSYSADYKFWTDIMRYGAIENIPKILTLYRTSEQQTSVVNNSACLKAAEMILGEDIEYYVTLFDKELGFSGIKKIIDLNLVSKKTCAEFIKEMISFLSEKKQ